MPSFLRILMQKVMPSARKSLLIKIRKKGGEWVDFLLPPKSTDFKADGMTYYIRGRPDVEMFTNQRSYSFLQGVSYPLNFDESHSTLIAVNKEIGNMDTAFAENEMIGFAKADLLKKKQAFDPLMVILIVGVIALANTVMSLMIMDKLGIKFM